VVQVSLTEILNQVKKSLKEVIPSPKYELIISPLEIKDISKEKVVLSTTSERQAQWLKDEYYMELVSAFSDALGTPVEVEIISEAVDTSEQGTTSQGLSVAKPLSEIVPVRRSLPLLNPRFTFENFVVGASNQFSYSAAKAVAERPGKAYNPLFIYSDVGLGKTHLVHSVGHRVIELFPSFRVVYVTSERFTSDFIEKVRSGRMNEFHQKYRQCDVLLIDDIQFISGKVETQVEFFHTFMSLVDAGKQVVLTSDAPPYELKNIEGRLVSRFSSGLFVDIGYPSLETRIAILQKKAELEGVQVDFEVLSFIAESIEGNVRDLEGALIRLIAFCDFSKVKCTLEVAKKVLGDFVKGRGGRRLVSIDEIVATVCEIFRIPKNLLLGRDRRKKVAESRMLAMYLAREYTNLTLSQIGEELGGRDHSTVSHALLKVAQLLDEDPFFKQMYQMVLRKLGWS